MASPPPSSCSFAIRPAAPDDIAVLAELQIAMAAETEGLVLDPETVVRGVAAVLADPGKGRYFVAADGPLVLGGLLVTPEWSDWRAGLWWWIQSVYVRPEARGRGLYRALYEHVKRQVEADPGLVGLRLYVASDNHSARRIYEHLGMDHSHYEMFEWSRGERPAAEEGCDGPPATARGEAAEERTVAVKNATSRS